MKSPSSSAVPRIQGYLDTNKALTGHFEVSETSTFGFAAEVIASSRHLKEPPVSSFLFAQVSVSHVSQRLPCHG